MGGGRRIKFSCQNKSLNFSDSSCQNPKHFFNKLSSDKRMLFSVAFFLSQSVVIMLVNIK